MTDDTAYDIYVEMERAINAFMESCDGKKLTLDKVVTLFKPVQNLLNDLHEMAESLEYKILELEGEIDDREPSHEETVKVGKTQIEVKTYGPISVYAQESLTLFLEALAKDEIECNRILNDFYIL